MNIARLKELINLLANIPEDHFDLGVWLEGVDGEGKSTAELLGSCGTSGCAVGWACTHKPFNDEGLEYKAMSIRSGVHVPTYRGHAQEDAVAAFFGLSSDLVEAIFYQESYASKWSEDEDGNDTWDIKPKDVAAVIQVVIDNTTKDDYEILKMIDGVKNA